MTKRGVVARVGASLYRIRCLVRKEFWQYRADKVFTAMLIALPLVQLFLVVRVMTGTGGSGAPIAVIDHDHSAISREWVRAMENTGEARVALWTDNMEEGNEALSQGVVDALVVIPPDFGRDLTRADRIPELQVAVDGASTWRASSVLNTLGATANSLASDVAASSGASLGITLRPTEYFRVERIQDPVTSQMGFLLFQVVLLASGLGLARERETGTLEQLLVTPLNRFELALGKTMPALVVGTLDFGGLYAAARLVWNTPQRGSTALLFGCALLFILAESAWGLFLSSLVKNQQQAVQLIFVQVLVDLSFCGYVVPVANLPWFLRWFSELLPLRHLLACIRSVMLRGGGVADIGMHLMFLVGLNVVFWTLVARTLRRQA